MRVICIDAKMYNDVMHSLIEGNVYNVTGLSSSYPDSYYLAEYPLDKTGRKCSYHKIHFAFCSEIDEMELVNELQESY